MKLIKTKLGLQNKNYQYVTPTRNIFEGVKKI